MSDTKKIRRGTICFCSRHTKDYYFVVLYLIADSALVLRITKPQKDIHTGFYCRNKDYNFNSMDKIGILMCSKLTAIMNIHPVALQKLIRNYKSDIQDFLLEKLTLYNQMLLTHNSKQSLKTFIQRYINDIYGIIFETQPQKPKNINHTYNLLKFNVNRYMPSSESATTFRVPPNKKCIKIYHGGRGG